MKKDYDKKLLFNSISLFDSESYLSLELYCSYFQALHAKKYDDAIMDTFRKKIFMQNSHMIIKHNIRHAKGEVSYRLRMNQFGDMVCK